MFGMPGHLELFIVAFVILLLFGHRLPSLMRSLGRGVVEFKQGLHGSGSESDGDDKVPSEKIPEKVSEKVNAE